MWLCPVATAPGPSSARASAGDEGRCPGPNAPTPSCPPRMAGWPTGRAPGTSCKRSCRMETCPWPLCTLSGEMLARTAAGWRSQDGSTTTRSTYAWVWRKVKKNKKNLSVNYSLLTYCDVSFSYSWKSINITYKCMFLNTVPTEEPAAKDWTPTTTVAQGEQWISEVNTHKCTSFGWWLFFFCPLKDFHSHWLKKKTCRILLLLLFTETTSAPWTLQTDDLMFGSAATEVFKNGLEKRQQMKMENQINATYVLILILFFKLSSTGGASGGWNENRQCLFVWGEILL